MNHTFTSMEILFSPLHCLLSYSARSPINLFSPSCMGPTQPFILPRLASPAGTFPHLI